MLPIIDLSGSPYEMGLQHGRRLKDGVRAMARLRYELAGEHAAVQEALANDEVAGLAGGVAGAGGGDALLDDAPALGGVLVEVDGELVGHRRLGLALDLGVA